MKQLTLPRSGVSFTIDRGHIRDVSIDVLDPLVKRIMTGWIECPESKRYEPHHKEIGRVHYYDEEKGLILPIKNSTV